MNSTRGAEGYSRQGLKPWVYIFYIYTKVMGWRVTGGMWADISNRMVSESLKTSYLNRERWVNCWRMLLGYLWEEHPGREIESAKALRWNLLHAWHVEGMQGGDRARTEWAGGRLVRDEVWEAAGTRSQILLCHVKEFSFCSVRKGSHWSIWAGAIHSRPYADSMWPVCRYRLTSMKGTGNEVPPRRYKCAENASRVCFIDYHLVCARRTRVEGAGTVGKQSSGKACHSAELV